MLLTPGISTGYWKARKMPSRARSSGRHLQQVLALVEHLAAGHLVELAAGQHLRQRALAASRSAP